MTEAFLHDSIEAQAQALAPAGRPLADLIGEMRSLYLEDGRPWVVGFSGGKDSTAVLQLIYATLASLEPDRRTKRVFVVSSDTLVETPVVIDLLKSTLSEVNAAAQAERLPIETCQVTPKADETFWVNLLGRGYSAPTQSFRWCTERMKINPVSAFILDKVAEHGEAVVVLGARSGESASRAQVIAKHKIDGSALSRHSSLPNAYVYTPIEDWTADEVWEFLMSAPRPWGGTNRDLLELYRGSNAGECPVVIDTSTPSCGNSRFGCWTCTVVSADRAMESLVEQGESWMRPLLDFRNKLAATTRPEAKAEYRNHKRRTGKVTWARAGGPDGPKYVPGPYWMRYRQAWTEELLTIQRDLNASGRALELIRTEELQAIRREWLCDPNEPDWTDALPVIFRRVFGASAKVAWPEDDAGGFGAEDAALVDEAADANGVPAALIQKLLGMEASMDGLARRKDVARRIEAILHEDWDGFEAALAKADSVAAGGWQEEIERLEALRATLNLGGGVGQ